MELTATEIFLIPMKCFQTTGARATRQFPARLPRANAAVSPWAGLATGASVIRIETLPENISVAIPRAGTHTALRLAQSSLDSRSSESRSFHNRSRDSHSFESH